MTSVISGRYAALSTTEIRLVRLSEDLGDIISGQLDVAALESAPPYYAISHAWVADESTGVVAHGNQLSLNKSLSTCIRRLQQLGYQVHGLNPLVRHVWIDNICINQRDTSEKSSQVALMGTIYSQSIRTLIWLGEPETKLIPGAWHLIAKIYNVFKEQYPKATIISDITLRAYDEKHHIASGLPPWNDLRWNYLKRLLSLRWFSRMWVIQEVVLSHQDPVILHGEHCYAWDTLGWAVAWMRRYGYVRLPRIPEQLRNVDTISNLRRAETRWPLDALMSITQIKFYATDQRDKIYGLLSLAAECHDPLKLPERLRPDYSLNVENLYQRVARFLLKESRSLSMLSRARGIPGTETRNNRHYDLELPSWCPDWSDFETYNLGISTSLSWINYSKSSSPAVLGFPNQYRASGNLEAVFPDVDQASDDESILELCGFKVDEVRHVHRFNIRRPKDGERADDLGAKIAPALNLALSLMSAHGITTWMESFIRSTTANQHQLQGKDMSQGFADGAAWLHDYFQRNQDFTSSHAKLNAKELEFTKLLNASTKGTPQHYEALARNLCFDRAFITTLEGKMGIAPSNTQAGDSILVLDGGGVPYVARRHGEQWLFVGESYIDGLMGGQTLRAHEAGLVRKEIFRFQ